jgi:hypothetical protein
MWGSDFGEIFQIEVGGGILQLHECFKTLQSNSLLPSSKYNCSQIIDAVV